MINKIRAGFNEKNKEIAELLEAREKLIKSGNQVDEVDRQLEELFKDYIYSPKMAVRESFLVEKTKTDEELQELQELQAYKEQIKENYFLKEFNKAVEDAYGKRLFTVKKVLKGARGFNNKIMYNEYYLPMSLKSFIATPWDSTLNPLNIFQIIMKDFETSVNKIDAKEINFSSLMFDENVNEYKKHYWKIIVQFQDETYIEDNSKDVDELA